MAHKMFRLSWEGTVLRRVLMCLIDVFFFRFGIVVVYPWSWRNVVQLRGASEE